MDSRQVINLAIHLKGEAEGGVFAYPPQTIHRVVDRSTEQGGAVEENNAGAGAGLGARRAEGVEFRDDAPGAPDF